MKIYTNEELADMTAEQLKAVILGMQTVQSDNTGNSEVVAVENTVEGDIAKLEEKAAALKADGEELYTDAIKAIEDKIAELKERAKADVKEVEQETTSCWVAHRYDIYAIAGIALLGYIAVRGLF
ncbi:MAG: hypothetical protein LLG02_14075 [Pelosinus sp.]|nr:hypothetical protein [Pelosinus sp.]